MPDRRLTQSKPEATKVTVFKQETFDGGLNLDDPASELKANELAQADNIICYDTYFKGRSGSTKFSPRILPGTGTRHFQFFHSAAKKWLVHRGSKLYRSDHEGLEWQELDLYSGANFDIDSDSQVCEYNTCAMVFTSSGIFKVDLEDPFDTVIYKVNTPVPTVALGDSGSGANYYRLLYTLARITGTTTNGRITAGAVLELETPPVSITNTVGRDYGELRTATEISGSAPATIYLSQVGIPDHNTDEISVTSSWVSGTAVDLYTNGTLPTGLSAGTTYYICRDSDTTIRLANSYANAVTGYSITFTDNGTGTLTIRTNVISTNETHFTHISIYRTLNLGEGFSDLVNDTGHNQEVYVWEKDVPISSIGSAGVQELFGNNPITLDVDDKVLANRANGYTLRSRKWTPLPNGNIGTVTNDWIFVANRGETQLNYGQIADSGEHIGYHFQPFQRESFRDGISALGQSPKILAVFCNNSVYTKELGNPTNKGLLELVSVLAPATMRDKTIGVKDWATVQEVEGNNFIAVCSDASVRVWNQIEWSDDYSEGKVNSEIRKFVAGTSVGYFQGAVYFWYRTSSASTYNDKCLRLALAKSAGRGWTTFSGPNWIYPPLATGPNLIIDSNGIQRLIVWDAPSNYLYWIDTFNGYSGSNLTETFIEKSTDPGLCPIGETYFYDALNDNSLSDSLTTYTVDGSVEEHQGYLTLRGDGTGHARVLVDYSIGAGDDFEAEIYLTEYSDYLSADSVPFSNETKYELKIAPFTTDGSDISIDSIAGGGLYLYGSFYDGRTDNQYSTYWKVQQGATIGDGNSIGHTSPLLGLRISKSGTTVRFYGDYGSGFVQLGTDYDHADFDTFGQMRCALTVHSNDVYHGEFGFNYWKVESTTGMPSSCVGLDGSGSSTVQGRTVECSVKFREVTGLEESWFAKTEIANAYFRPVNEAVGYPASFSVDASGYVDGNPTPVETIEGAPFRGNISWFKEQSGHRLQLGLQTNSSQFRCVGASLRYLIEDKRSLTQNISLTNNYSYQRVLSSDLKHWLTVPNFQVDRGSGTRFTQTGTITYETGPNGKSRSGFSFGASTSLTRAATTSYQDFTLVLWVKTPANNGNSILTIAGTNPLTVSFPASDQVRFDSGTINCNNVSDGNWHLFVLKRITGTRYWYQNNTLLDSSASPGDVLGGGNLTIGGDIAGSILCDVRVYNAAKSVDAITYYYGEMLNSSQGKLVLPYG